MLSLQQVHKIFPSCCNAWGIEPRARPPSNLRLPGCCRSHHHVTRSGLLPAPTSACFPASGVCHPWSQWNNSFQPKPKSPPAPPPPSPCSPGAWSPDGMCGLGRGAAAHRLPNSPLKVQQLDSRDVSPVVAVDHMCVSPGLITSCRNRHWDLVLGLLSLPSGIERIRVGQPKQEPHDQGQTKASGFRASRVWAVLWLSIREHSLTMGKPVSSDCSSFERILHCCHLCRISAVLLMFRA